MVVIWHFDSLHRALRKVGESKARSSHLRPSQAIAGQEAAGLELTCWVGVGACASSPSASPHPPPSLTSSPPSSPLTDPLHSRHSIQITSLAHCLTHSVSREQRCAGKEKLQGTEEEEEEWLSPESALAAHSAGRQQACRAGGSMPASGPHYWRTGSTALLSSSQVLASLMSG